jgi:gliding motility-associated-like protein
MKESKNIEQLFRTEFESFEVQPSKKVWRGVRYDLFIKNFLHFSPWSFNAWYAGGALILASVLAYTFINPGDKEISVNRTNSDRVLFIENDTMAIDGGKQMTGEVKPVATTGRKASVNPIRKQRPGSNITNDRKLKPEDIQQPKSAVSHESEQTEENFTNRESISTYSGQSVLAWFKCSSPEGCVPLTANFQNLSQYAVRYSWSFGDGGSSDLLNPSYIFDEPGTWFVSLTAFSANNEISIYTDSIQVNPKPEARFSMDIQGVQSDGLPVYFYNNSRGAENFLWEFGDGSVSVLRDPDHYFTKKSQTNIKLLAISATGCKDSIILLVAFKEGEPVFIFPTAFSPSTTGPGSGQYSRKSPANDVFYPYVEEEPEEYQLRIFNRNGVLLFESNDIHTGWDGYYREELLPQGVYVWKARAKFPDGRSVVRVGDVTLLWGE